MDKLKLLIGLAIIIAGFYISTKYVEREMQYYYKIASPQEEVEELGPPITAAPIALSAPIVPAVGSERDDDAIEGEVTQVLMGRRITASDINHAYSFISERCMKCHEEDGPGTWFYGMENFEKDQLFATKEGLVLRSWTEKLITPTLNYIYKDTHAKKVPFEVGGSAEELLKRAQ
jgi:hypothetical protein